MNCVFCLIAGRRLRQETPNPFFNYRLIQDDFGFLNQKYNSKYMYPAHNKSGEFQIYILDSQFIDLSQLCLYKTMARIEVS